MRLLRRLVRLVIRDDGPTTTEYAVLLALIVGVALLAIKALGGGVEGKWQQNAQKIVTSIGG
jgi:Flp pilus assembly pilin Flp